MQAGSAIDDVFSRSYEELRHIAISVAASEKCYSDDCAALVHEAWLKLKDSQELAAKPTPEFKLIVANAMRQILVDKARERLAKKRCSPEAVSSTAPCFAKPHSHAAQLFVLDAALQRLAERNIRHAEIVQSRFFSGRTVSETAALLGVSKSVVERDWRAARDWLAKRIVRRA